MESLFSFGDSAILVSRVSTPEQVLNQECNPQISDLQQYAERLGYKNFKIIGTTESGFLKEDNKIGWNLVTNFIHEHPQYRTIICTEMSRMGRDEEILSHIKKYLLENKVQLIIKDLNFELFNRFGEIDEGRQFIFSLYASLETNTLMKKKERFKRALREYKKMGYSIGGKRLFGYMRIVDGKLGKKSTYVINEEEAKQIKTIYNWYINGIDGDLTKTSIRRIAYECKARDFSTYLHSKRNVNKCLKEQAYIGFKITKNKKRNANYWNYKDESAKKYVDAESYECTYPQIIEETVFNRVQDKLSRTNTHYSVSNNRLVDKSHKHTTILSKIIECPNCNSYYIGDYRIKNGFIGHTYRCCKAKGKLLRKCNNTKTISMVMADSVIWAFVKAKVRDITTQINLTKKEINVNLIKNEIERLLEDLTSFDNRIETENIIFRTNMRKTKDKDAAISTYENKIKQIENERKSLLRIVEERERVLVMLSEESANSNIDELITQNTERIERDKKEMYKYIHLLVKSVIPIYSNDRYTLLQITACNNYSEILDYSKEDNNGLPCIIGQKHDSVYYVCINKHNTNKIECRLITDNQISYNEEKERFMLNGVTYSIEDIFSINLEETDPRKFTEIQRGVELLPYKRLTFYNEDINVS